MQWSFPELFGEDKFVVMLSGLHVEMALLNTMGDILPGSGWPEVLNDGELVKTQAATTGFLKASAPMRTNVPIKLLLLYFTTF